MNSDDEQPTLSADTLAILRDFLAEEAKNKEVSVSNDGTTNYFKENWETTVQLLINNPMKTFTVLDQIFYGTFRNKDPVQGIQLFQLSQFWYSTDTIKALAKIVKNVVPNGGKVALISCPSLYPHIRKVLNLDCDVILFEYDERFNVYGKDFCFYDFNHPLDYPSEYESSFDIVVADPPYLSEDCLIKVAETIKGIKKENVILCTGRIQEKIVQQHLRLKLVNFKPQHSSNLANEFSCFSNFELDSILQDE